MSIRTFRVALLSAGLLSAPLAARQAVAADGDAKPARARATTQPAGGRVDPNALIERVEAALKDVSLTDDQKAKAKSVLADARKSIEELAGDGKGKLQVAARTLTDLRDGLNGLLTEDQKKALSGKLPFLGRGAAGGTEARPAAAWRAVTEALEKLELSADQKAKLKSLNDDLEKKFRSAIEDAKGDRAAIVEKIRPLMEERRKQLSEILSSEQATKLQQAVREKMQQLAARPGEAPADEKKAAGEKSTGEKDGK